MVSTNKTVANDKKWLAIYEDKYNWAQKELKNTNNQTRAELELHLKKLTEGIISLKKDLIKAKEAGNTTEYEQDLKWMKELGQRYKEIEQELKDLGKYTRTELLKMLKLDEQKISNLKEELAKTFEKIEAD